MNLLRVRVFNVLFACLALCLLLSAGCGGSGYVPVKGKVLLDGQPMTKGAVRFIPNKSKGNNAGVEPVGTISPAGEYQLITNGEPGAPLGWYLVTVDTGFIPDSSKPFEKETGGVASRFGKPETSAIEIEVVASPSQNGYEIKVSSK